MAQAATPQLQPVKPKLKPQTDKECIKERLRLEAAHKKVKKLSKHFHDLLLNLDLHVKENNILIEKTQKSLGARITSYVLSLPIDRAGVIGNLLQRYFDGIINKELQEGAKTFMKQSWIVKQRIKYSKDQATIVFAQLEKASLELKDAEEGLQTCVFNKEK